MQRRGQGAFEYILFLAGILLVVILVIVVLRSSVLAQTNAGIGRGLNTFTSLTNVPPIDGLLFVAHFNDNLLSHKGETGSASGNVTFPPARFGDGVRVIGGGVNFTSFGNINPAQGTVAAWVRHPFTGTVGRVFEVAVGGPPSVFYNLGLDPVSGQVGAGIGNGSVFQTTNFALASVPWAANELHHVAMTWDATNGLRFYVDGVLVNSSSPILYAQNLSTTVLGIGYRWSAPDLSFNGTIDEFAIYSRALSADEVRRLVQTTLEIPA